MKAIVLVVEDDRKISALVAKNLEAAGMQCYRARESASALELFERTRPEVIVMDIMIPGIDGLELTRRIRQESNVPILLLTARSGESVKVLGLEIGADNYLTKPFSTLELVARVRALLRRSTAGTREEILERGDLYIDPGNREVRRGEDKIELTTLEFDLLYFMASRAGRVFSREALMEHVWGGERFVDERSIDSLISRLRRKLEPKPSKPIYIQTVWGAGYRFPRME
ncbi:MAG: response regulator [Candidatus Latescibacteria bacterium]|nr:response regulator [Candidatus Latescibacterota bacterium]NIO57244.1 response regulator [Candidatus Latescibacterota bacterium]